MTPRRVFILGCHRSGTTLLRLILNSHRGIHCFDEWKSYKILESGIFPNLAPVLGFKIPNWTDLIVDTEEYKKHYNGEPILFVMRDVRGAIASMLSLRTGKGTWLEGLYEKMDEVWSTDPHKRKFFEIYGRKFKCLKGFPLPEQKFIAAALFWRYKTSRYLEMIKLGWKVLPVKYECLVQTPRSYIKIILDFLDIEWDDNLLNHHKLEHDETFDGIAVGDSLVSRAIDANSVFKWQSMLTKEQEQAVLETAGEWNDFVSP